MHYKIGKVEIRSENAAKPIKAAAAPLVAWLRNRKHVTAALDYGCGKLRYTDFIAQRCTYLGIVDSKVQLTRTQRIDGHKTTITEYAKIKWPNCRIYDIKAFWDGIPHLYDFVLCANVLSTIPSAKTRAKSFRAIGAALHAGGEVLVVNQHTNSYFTEIRAKPTTVEHLNGWIAQSRNGVSYYGVLKREFVIHMLTGYGFIVVDSWLQGQSNYVLARKR